MPVWLWAAFTVAAAGAQTFRNVTQRELIATLGTVGATHVRFLFGLPFAVLFLAGLVAATGWALPVPKPATLGYTLLGAGAQIVATALMLSAMRARSFVVTIAYTKTEPIQLAIVGALVLGDRPNATTVIAILVATAGVMLMSWPRSGATGPGRDRLGPPLLGIFSGAMFAASSIGYRGAILSLDTPHFPIAASSVLVMGLLTQALALSAYLLVADRAVLRAIFASWRPSLAAGFLGALASQFWFLAFALASAASVRTLALVEMVFAQLVARRVLREGVVGREVAGMALVVGGVLLLLRA